MLLHRNYGENYLNFDLSKIVRLIGGASKKEHEDRLWQVWLVLLGQMKEDNYISFEEYKRKIDSRIAVNEKTTEELYEMAEKIKKADLRR